MIRLSACALVTALAAAAGLATLATASPTSAAQLPAPAPAPTLDPGSPEGKPRDGQFIVGDYVFSPKVYDELGHGNTGRTTFHVTASAAFPVFALPWILEGDLRSNHFQAGANGPSGTGTCPSGDQTCLAGPRDDEFDGRVALNVAAPRIYIGVGYLLRTTTYEGDVFPTQLHGLGGGIEKLPDLGRRFSIYGSAYYYPNATADTNQDRADGTFGATQYRILKYGIGGTFGFGKTPVYLDFGFLGDRLFTNQTTSNDPQHTGPYAGLGIHF